MKLIFVKKARVRRLCASCAAALLPLLPSLAHADPPRNALPVPCIAGTCGAGVAGFVQSGQAGATSVGTTLTINQATERAILNWQSFDVGADGKVIFVQPDSSSIALNRIHQAAPSQIFGAVEANGQIYLVNQNGIVFGATARVKTAGLVASSLNISDDVFEAGIVAPELVRDNRAALESDGRVAVLNSEGQPVIVDGKPLEVQLRVDNGAKIVTTPGGRVILASRTVDNAGSIETPDGQTLIAAGEKVYLQASSDPSLRGLLVEVDTGGTAWNRATGDISARRGNVTIAGLAVNQDGRVSATTSVNSNGSIRLLGRDSMQKVPGIGGRDVIAATSGGTVRLGDGSRTVVTPELEDATTAVDDQVQVPSSLEISGRQVTLAGGSRIELPGGNVNITARANPSVEGRDSSARVRMESGAVIDVSGSTATADVERNLVTVELRANELRDAPVQRDGPLRGKAVVVDARVGTPFGDVKGALDALPRDIAERTSAGGHVKLNSDGDVALAADSLIDVSGGAVVYRPGVIQTSMLVGANGRLTDISRADPNQLYVDVINPSFTRSFDRWGVEQTIAGPNLGHYDPGYTEGRAAGSVEIQAPAMVLNGLLQGHATAGLYQRDPATIPAGGQLILGRRTPEGDSLDYRAPSVTLTATRPNIVVGPSGPVPSGIPLELSTDFLMHGGFTSAQISSNGTVSLRAGNPLTLVPGSTLDVRGAAVDIASDITASSGSLLFAADLTLDNADGAIAPTLRVADGVTLDVSGRWQNELLDPVGAMFRNGGTIDLASRSTPARPGALRLGEGVRLLANGGASMSASGALTGGTGGGIALRSPQRDSVFDIAAGVGLEAFGVQGARGGTFTLEARTIGIGNGDVWAPAQMFDPAAEDAGELKLGSALFRDHGFGTFNITATGSPRAADPDAEPNPDVLTVHAGTRIDARAVTLEIAGPQGARAAEANVSGFTRRLMQPEYLQAASTVSLRVDPRDSLSQDMGRLHLAADSVLTGAARSTFNLASPGGMLLEGQVYSMGGTINASVGRPPAAFDTGYLPDLALDVASSARLDVSGGVILRPNDAGLRFGEVLGGGAVNLLADRGSVLLRRGSSLDVSGTSGEIDLPAGINGRGFERQAIASAGGTVALRSPEAILISGEMRAAAGTGGQRQAPGGTLDLQTTRRRNFDFGSQDLEPTYPVGPRTLRVIPDSFAGTPTSGLSVLQARDVTRFGFDSLTLEADVVSFDAGVELALARDLHVDAPVIDVAPGAPVKLAASYVALGPTQATSAAPVTAGTGQLTVRGDLVDVIGGVSLARAGLTRLESRGDLRLRGLEVGGESHGRLASAGDIELAAARIYPTTATQFVVDAGDADVRISRTGTDTGTPLSAGGSLTIRAAQIEQGGTLLAPFGEIRLLGRDRVTLADGSLTSVSANGALLPYGRVDLGTTWLLGIGDRFVEQTSIPERRVDIESADVEMNAGATVDLRGGGDLYAFNWLPGTGGSRDVLDAAANNGYYAVIPGVGTYAPYDPQEAANSPLKTGESVYLSGGGGLEAGAYALLPARYALLPGAFLVRRVAGYNDIMPASNAVLPDGSTVVAGWRTFGASGLGETRTAGYAVLPGSAAHDLASYEDYSASTFFAQRAQRLELDHVALPVDAGQLGLFASQALQAGGTVRTGAGKDGRGALIDIAAQALELGTGAAREEGAVRIDASTVAGWNAASVLFGGRRSADGTQIEALSDTLLVDSGTSVDAAEILTIANSTITVAEGATLTSSAAAAARLAEHELTLTGGNGAAPALLALSNASQFRVVPTTAPASLGRVEIEAGARVGAKGSIYVGAPGGAQLAGRFDVAGADVTLRSGSLVFGAENPNGIGVTAELAASLGSAGALRFGSDSSIDFLGSFTLGSASAPLGLIELEANRITAGADAGQVSLFARDLLLRGGQSQAAPGIAGTANLAFSADQLTLGGGYLDFDGVDALSFDVRGDFLTARDFTLRTPGSLDIRTNRFITGTGAEDSGTVAGASADLSSAGDLRVTRATQPLAGTVAAGLGGGLTLSGRNVEFAGMALLPSGSVSLRADEHLDLGAGAHIDVAGRMLGSAEHRVAAPGGSVLLSAGTGIDASADARLDLAGAPGANGGLLQVRTPGRAALGAQLAGGSVRVDAGALDDFATLAQRLEAGGFGDTRDIRVRAGDLAIDAGNTWTARHISLAADTGRIDVHGSLQATSGDERATVELSAGNGLALHSGAAIRATGSMDLGRGGIVTLSSRGGRVDLAPGASIDVSGASEAGAVNVRAAALSGDVAVDRLDSLVKGTTAIALIPILAFDDLPEFLDATVLDGYAQQARDWLAASGAAVRARLEHDAELRIQPGLDLRRGGDLGIEAMDLSAWRFDGEPAELSLRATGNVNVNPSFSSGILGDGFVTVGFGAAARHDLRTDRSTSLRIVAGADLGAADPDTVTAGTQADLFLNGVTVRTGTGSLTLAAARDIGFAEGSSVYTGGLAGAPALSVFRGPLVVFATGGGALTLDAGRDIAGSQVMQAVGDWQVRQGRSGENPLPTRWGTNVAAFRWNTGTLGGGDLHVNAGHDVRDLTAAAADAGYQSADGSLLGLRGGVLSIDAGNDVSSPFLHVTAGDNQVRAGGGLTQSRFGLSDGAPLGALFSIQDARLDLQARGPMHLMSAFNPTMLVQPGALVAQRSYFFTYGTDAGLSATSIAGDIDLQYSRSNVAAYIGQAATDANESATAFSSLPPSLSLHALSGDLDVQSEMFLFPSDRSNLDLFAARDLDMTGRLVMSDAAASLMPSALLPQATTGAFTDIERESQALRHAGDSQPARISAGRDLRDLRMFLPKAAYISAGRDLLDLSLQAQNLDGFAETRVSAGRDIVQTQFFSRIDVGGPGRLDVLAGRDIDLGFSEGITTSGRLRNPLLPARGADVTAIAGLSRALDVDSFVDNIIEPIAEYARLLIDFVEEQGGESGLDFAAAREKFDGMSADAQRPLLVDVFFKELVFAGREANRDPASNFARGYAAIDALFKDSRDPDPEGTEGFVNPFAGDLKLAFSRIYTLSGGDINLLVPGGLVDVGLAVPPAVGAPQRDPDDLGIVAQRAGSVRVYSMGDVLVNQSRIFTLAGGDIAIWSTLGDIDAGRGAKSAISAPAPQVIVDGSGNVQIDLAGAVAGSGIRGILTDPTVDPGDVDLIAPAGIVNAGDAGIGAAGNLNVAAQQVVGLDNIQVGGTSTGVPADTSNLGASLSGVSAVSSSASQAATKDMGATAGPSQQAALADTALGWLDVFLEGFGEEVCKANDQECLDRNKK